MRMSRIAIAAGAAVTVTGAGGRRRPGGGHRRDAPRPAMQAACPVARPGQVRCFTLYAPQTAVNVAIAERAAGKQVPPGATTPKGWGPKSIQSAYQLPTTRGAGQTVALVDAYSTPHLAADLAIYRSHYGLPPCTTASGCLRIVNQQGTLSPLPKPDPLGLGIEETLDVSMVSAACPLCKIIVVEGNSATLGSLAAAETPPCGSARR